MCNSWKLRFQSQRAFGAVARLLGLASQGKDSELAWSKSRKGMSRIFFESFGTHPHRKIAPSCTEVLLALADLTPEDQFCCNEAKSTGITVLAAGIAREREFVA